MSLQLNKQSELMWVSEKLTELNLFVGEEDFGQSKSGNVNENLFLVMNREAEEG